MTPTYAANDRPDPYREASARQSLACRHVWAPYPGYRNSVPRGWLGLRCALCKATVSRRA